MTMPDDKQKKSVTDRFHNIISSANADNESEEKPKSQVFDRLPKKAKPVDVSAKQPATPPPPSPDSQSGPRLRGGFLPIFWTVASALSLTVNIVLLIVLGIVLFKGNALGLGNGLLGGLYSNFERMDEAHIKANIPVQTSIPLNLSIPVQTTTGITLAQDVAITGAHVKINTQLFNIDAPADVTLPAGTALNVVLNFSVPVQTDVPVTLNVPVDIPLQATELHPAITGLQDTIKPIYCLINPFALSLKGGMICP
jgi:hypothetical protein